MTEEVADTHLPSGTACIKAEYLKADHVRQLNVEFVTVKDKRTMHTDGDGGPSKKKLKGQNKHRPREKRCPKSEKLCFSVNGDRPCALSKDCPYSHDVVEYLKQKPPDIGKKCYLYETFGRCMYGFSCRYGSQHIVDEKNAVNEELYSKFKDKPNLCNILTSELKWALRKRTYQFEKANTVFKTLQAMKNSNSDPLKTGNVAAANFCNVLDSELKQTSEKAVIDAKDQNDPQCEIKKQDCLSNIMDSKLEGLKTPMLVDKDNIRMRLCEIKKIDFADKLYLAPLTTVGNLPFRRLCKEFGVDITCSEMAMADTLLRGGLSEWALLKRHHTEDIFGVQLCGAHGDVMTRCSQVISENASVDFIDVNMGCPLDQVYRMGAGCGLMNRTKKLREIILGMSSVVDVPLTLKMRTGLYARDNIAHNVIKKIHEWGDRVQLITLHGRSREQRYTKSAKWDYINQCSELAHPIPLFGSGDVLSFEDYNLRRQQTKVSGLMIARGALIKPWIFKEIKEQQHWDISSSERFEIIKKYVNYGLEHWGSDTEGVEKTRRFLLEWLSFLYRYIPVGLLERIPQRINERPPPYYGRDDLETLMASSSCADWVKISEMLLGPVPENFIFLPKHKANAYG